MPFFSRLFYAFSVFLRVLADGAFAARVRDLASQPGLLPAPAPPERPEPAPPPEPARTPLSRPPADAALWLLGLMQREGRLVDFLQQDVEGFSDADIGAAARVVHSGCREALAAHVTVQPVRTEAEGSPITLEAGFDPSTIKLTGNVGGSPPHRGTLRHRGWRAEKVELPELVEGHDVTVLAPAEVEL
jgi:hypothetical protein